MTSGEGDQVNMAIEENIIRSVFLLDGCVAMVSHVLNVAMGTKLTSIFFGHTLIGWLACLQFFNLRLQPGSGKHTHIHTHT